MKTKLLFIVLLCLGNMVAGAQTAPPLQWQKPLGGSGEDDIARAYYGTDGSSVLCGQAGSTDGDATGNHGYNDGWVVKLDASGSLVWQKSYGGSLNDGIFSIKGTTDNGYIMCGYTGSTDWDVTGNHGGIDGWVIKTDNWGVIQWKKAIGGTKEDAFDGVMQTADGGYILVGRSASSDGDLNQNKGLLDGWVVKLDAAGAIEWQKNYGGSKDDYLFDIIQLSDNNYICAGISKSANANLPGNYGGTDAWFLKINASNGAIQWSYQYGGSGNDAVYELKKPTDGTDNIVAAGYTTSPNDYNVTGNHGQYDVWVVTIDQVNGILKHATCFGGSGDDFANSIQNTFDKGFVIAATSGSTDGDVSYNADPLNWQLWVIKLNNAETIDWEKTYGGPQTETGIGVFEKATGGYFAAAATWGNGGDVSGYHGTVGRDYWALTLSPCFVPPASSATINAAGPACGDSLELSMPGGPAYFYHWYKNSVEIPGAESKTYVATTPGTYTGVAVNAACLLSTFSPNSIVSKKQKATITPSGTVNKCAADLVQFTANNGTSLTYQWYRNNAAIAGATAKTYSTKKPGRYKVAVMNTATGCLKNSPVTTVNNTCRETIAGEDAILDVEPLVSLAAWPNPANNNVTLKINGDDQVDGTLLIYDITGKLKYKMPVQDLHKNHVLSIITQDWVNGIYYGKLVAAGDNNTMLGTIKIVVQH